MNIVKYFERPFIKYGTNNDVGYHDTDKQLEDIREFAKEYNLNPISISCDLFTKGGVFVVFEELQK